VSFGRLANGSAAQYVIYSPISAQLYRKAHLSKRLKGKDSANMGLVTIGQAVHKIYQKEGEGVTRQERVLWWRVVGVARRWVG
jgi:hypothetical protein